MIQKPQNDLMVFMIVKSIIDEASCRIHKGQNVESVRKQAAGALGQLVRKANETGFAISDWAEETMWAQVESFFLEFYTAYFNLTLDKNRVGA